MIKTFTHSTQGKTNMRRISEKTSFIVWASAIVGSLRRWDVQCYEWYLLVVRVFDIVSCSSSSNKFGIEATGSKWDSVDRYDDCYLMFAHSLCLPPSVHPCVSSSLRNGIDRITIPTKWNQREEKRVQWAAFVSNEYVNGVRARFSFDFGSGAQWLCVHIVYRYIVFSMAVALFDTATLSCNILRVTFFSFDRRCDAHSVHIPSLATHHTDSYVQTNEMMIKIELKFSIASVRKIYRERDRVHRPQCQPH